MIGPQQCYRTGDHVPHVWKRETNANGEGDDRFCAGVWNGLAAAFRVGGGGSGPDKAVPECPVCGASGGGGHGGLCPNG